MVMIPLADLIEVSSLHKGLDIRKSLTRDLGFPRPNQSTMGKTRSQSEVVTVEGWQRRVEVI